MIFMICLQTRRVVRVVKLQRPTVRETGAQLHEAVAAGCPVLPRQRGHPQGHQAGKHSHTRRPLTHQAHGLWPVSLPQTTR